MREISPQLRMAIEVSCVALLGVSFRFAAAVSLFGRRRLGVMGITRRHKRFLSGRGKKVLGLWWDRDEYHWVAIRGKLFSHKKSDSAK